MSDQAISIVMLEDSELDAELALAQLDASGLLYSARRVETRADFLQAITEKAPDIILSDFALPDFDGRSALSLAREHCPEVPFIFVSGVMGEEVAVETLQSGATDYVLKQRLARLLPAVQRALREAGIRREAHRAEQALRHNEERLRIALHTARLGDWELDLATGVIYCSAICKANFGLPADADFSYERLRAAIVPEDLELVSRRVDDAIATRGIYEAEYRVTWPDGSSHWILASGRAVYDGGGQATRMVGVTLDISRRKEAENELARQARELEVLNKDLEQFAYAASHDLQEPLRNISSFAALLARRYTGRLDADADEFLQFIISSAQRMNDLLHDLLAYARIPVEDRQSSPVDMNAALKDVLDFCRGSILETGATVTADRLPLVYGHSALLRQVLHNLIGNAIKYRRDVAPVVQISAESNGAHWTFKVCDNGVGFDPQYAERIFGLFKRLHKTRYPGTGLGLAICKRIIERHNGKIWAESQPGQGSTFYFTLPYESAPPAKSK